MYYKNEDERIIVVDGKEYVVDNCDGFDALEGIVSESLLKYIREVYDWRIEEYQNDIEELEYQIKELSK